MQKTKNNLPYSQCFTCNFSIFSKREFCLCLYGSPSGILKFQSKAFPDYQPPFPSMQEFSIGCIILCWYNFCEDLKKFYFTLLFSTKSTLNLTNLWLFITPTYTHSRFCVLFLQIQYSWACAVLAFNLLDMSECSRIYTLIYMLLIVKYSSPLRLQQFSLLFYLFENSSQIHIILSYIVP